MATQQAQHYEQRECSSRPMKAGVTVIMVEETLRPQLLHEADTAETSYIYGLHTHTKYS